MTCVLSLTAPLFAAPLTWNHWNTLPLSSAPISYNNWNTHPLTEAPLTWGNWNTAAAPLNLGCSSAAVLW
ncbi:hypothetical protein BpHYR1_037337 [Brachionus plicatilis]|uniref:Uncharacterized protein n=1 Tax=Brachionus plicatilis TaxID=10195 RepID=A0A3M7PYU6_BRAPC|nr:hypothetical protein BpHYR1_037337 [Brachionus plicatilis]